jgi:hypothetical protein
VGADCLKSYKNCNFRYNFRHFYRHHHHEFATKLIINPPKDRLTQPTSCQYLDMIIAADLAIPESIMPHDGPPRRSQQRCRSIIPDYRVPAPWVINGGGLASGTNKRVGMEFAVWGDDMINRTTRSL